MKKLFFLLPIICSAQALVPTLSEPFAYPGSTVNMTVYLVDATPSAQITSIQFTPTLPIGFTLGTPLPATVTCTGGVCAATAATTYASQPIATIPVTVGAGATLGLQSITLGTPTAANATGAIAITAPTPAPITINASTGTTLWFSFSSGGTSCKASKVAQLPIRVSVLCDNVYGAYAGSYTADPTNGGMAGNAFTISLNSIGLPTYSSAFCMIYMNGTSAPIMIPGAAVQANSAAYQCSGMTATGTSSVAWP